MEQNQRASRKEEKWLWEQGEVYDHERKEKVWEDWEESET